MKIVVTTPTKAGLNTLAGPHKKLPQRKCKSGEAGFTLIETTIAMVVMMIAALGAAALFSYSINYNSGGSNRLVALALAQEQLERIRSAQFNSTTTDTILAGGTLVQTGLVRNGQLFALTTTIDDDPATANVDIDTATSLKRITVAVAPQNISPGWSLNAGARITLITQRSRSDQ